MFDVVAVDLKTLKVRLIAENKTERDANAIEEMAVIRRGVKQEFFSAVKHGAYKEGQQWDGVK